MAGPKNWAWTILVHFLVLSADNHEAKKKHFFGYFLIEHKMAAPMGQTITHLVHTYAYAYECAETY
jgi:hypothetical protein